MGIFCYGSRGRMHTCMAIFFWTGIARRCVLNELEVCDFDKTWSAYQ